MSPTAFPLPATTRHLRCIIRWCCAATALGFALNGMAQSIRVSTPTVPLVPRAVQDALPPTPNTLSDGTEVTVAPFIYGQFKLRPQLVTSYLHADGLPSGAGLSLDSEIFSFSPGITAEVGQHWTFNYTPTWVNYSEKSMQDSVNQSVYVNWGTAVNDWILRFTESYQSSDDVLAETAQQTQQHSWSTVLSGERKIGTRSTYEGTLALDERYGDQFPDARTWSIQQWLKTQISPKIGAGFGLDLGYVDISQQPDMKYEQYLGDLTWKPTTKLSLAIQGGLEVRHSEAVGTENLRNPILDLSLGYQPFDHTRITISRTRTVANSYFNDAVTKNTGWSATLNQRLLEKLSLSLTYNHQTSKYVDFGTSTSPTSGMSGRTDKIDSFNSSLSVKLFQRWNLSAVYQSSKNDSNDSLYSFSTTQYGLELSGSF